MAPIRRYLRISKYSVLECRIYLDNPSLAQSWLLNPRDPVLPRVIECIRPLVLPKLREEKELSRKKGNKKKGIKDVIEADEFEVSMFLTETATRHSILRKHKHIRDKAPRRMQSNSSKLLGETSASPIDVDDAASPPPALREEEGDEVALDSIPEAGAGTSDAGQGKRRREPVESGSEFEDDDEVEVVRGSAPPPKRARQGSTSNGDDEDKKKMAVDISYEGFAIYGRVLCLVVKRRNMPRSKVPAAAAPVAAEKPTGHAMMENWISSTQVPVGMEDEAEAG